MITAVDTNILLDILGAGEPFGPPSMSAMRRCIAEGAVVACDVVWAETVAWFSSLAAFEEAMTQMRVRFEPVVPAAAAAAGTAWREYRATGGPRRRLVADFIVGAHAMVVADRLLTRDRGFFRRYFTELRVLDPSRG